MKHLKTFESYSINESFFDYFKSREQIADKFMDLLAKNPEEALESAIPYYADFVDNTSYPHSREYSSGKVSGNFLPQFSKIYKEEGRGNFVIDKSKMNLVGEITKEEVLNLLSIHRDFSLRKIARDLLTPITLLAGTTFSGYQYPSPVELDLSATVKDILDRPKKNTGRSDSDPFDLEKMNKRRNFIPNY